MAFYGLVDSYDQHLRGEHEETYWTSLLLIYEAANNYDCNCAAYHKKQYHTNMTNFDLRDSFRALAFEHEMANWFSSGLTDDYAFNNLLRSREVPDMQTYFPQMLEIQVGYFFDKYGQHLGIDNQNHGEEVTQWLRNLLMVVPQDTSFYCLHCKNEVNIMIINQQQQQQHVCPRCGGWYLFERRDPMYIPMEPTNWGMVCERLWPSFNIDSEQPPLTDPKEADIGDLEEAADSLCVICEADYNLPGKVPVKLPCNHIFHSECVTEWFERKHYRRHCPKCRRLLPTVDPLFNIELRLIATKEDYPPPFP